MEHQNRPLIIFIVILSFVAGVIGGVGGMALVAGSPALQRSIGIGSEDAMTIAARERVENITVREDSAVVDAVKKISPSVVSIVFTKDIEVANPFFGFGYPFGEPERSIQRQQGGGTGFVISSDGLVATNKHVAGVEGAEYTVIAQDGNKYEAQVLAQDPLNDFAILKIEARNLPVVEFGDSDKLDIGQRVIAIGNALGEFQNTVTVGVLSGKERMLIASDETGARQEALDGLLQIDAAINQGNSGGPLCNLRGQVIGMNTATTAKGQAEGIGFAIPVNSLKVAIDSIKQTGRIIRPYLGIRYVMVDQKIAAIKGMEADRGALVIGDESRGIPAIVKDSPADRAGIKEGDVILAIGGEEIGQNKSLIRALSKFKPGDEVALKVLRDGGEMEVKVRLGEMPE